jgi:hypothetical protein
MNTERRAAESGKGEWAMGKVELVLGVENRGSYGKVCMAARILVDGQQVGAGFSYLGSVAEATRKARSDMRRGRAWRKGWASRIAGLAG